MFEEVTCSAVEFKQGHVQLHGEILKYTETGLINSFWSNTGKRDADDSWGQCSTNRHNTDL